MTDVSAEAKVDATPERPAGLPGAKCVYACSELVFRLYGWCSLAALAWTIFDKTRNAASLILVVVLVSLVVICPAYLVGDFLMRHLESFVFSEKYLPGKAKTIKVGVLIFCLASVVAISVSIIFVMTELFTMLAQSRMGG